MGNVIRFKRVIAPHKEYEIAVKIARDSLNKIVNWSYVSRFSRQEIEELVGALLALNRDIHKEMTRDGTGGIHENH